jgi:TM2 domain-containing membrane protein YozV
MSNLQALIPGVAADELGQIGHFADGLNDEQLQSFATAYQSQRKDSTTVLLLALFLGGVGAHYFYLGKTGLGVLYLFTLGFFWVGAIVDCFRAKSLALDFNRDLAAQIASNVRGHSRQGLSSQPR